MLMWQRVHEVVPVVTAQTHSGAYVARRLMARGPSGLSRLMGYWAMDIEGPSRSRRGEWDVIGPLGRHKLNKGTPNGTI